MKHNPLGMVPTLVSEATFLEDDSPGSRKPPVRESLVAIEFVDELRARRRRAHHAGVPVRARQGARRRRRREQTNMQQVLPRAGAPDPAEQREGFEALVKGLEAFGGELVANEPGTAAPSGSFFGGAKSPGLVDYALFPWAHRLPVFEHYRGKDFAIPPEHTESTQVPRLARRDARARLCEKDVPALGRLPRAHRGATRTARRDPRWPTPCATGGTRTSTTTRKMTHATDSNKYKVVCVLTRIDPRRARVRREKSATCTELRSA